MNYVCVKLINQGSGKNFDAFSCNSTIPAFCLADGANSEFLSGKAANFASNFFTNKRFSGKKDLLDAYQKLHYILNHEYPNSACTSAHIQFNQNNALISCCGDSLIEIFQREKFFFSYWLNKSWSLTWQSQLDELSESNNPSQLIGCNAYKEANISSFDFKKQSLVILSTDGLHRFIGINDRLKLINYIDKNIPTEDDLNYICQTLITSAIANGSNDDISIAAIWLSPNEG